MTAPALTWRRVLPRLAAGLLLRWALVLALLVVAGLVVTRVADRWWPFTVEDGVNRALAAGRTEAGNHVSAVMSAFGNTSTIVPACLVAVVALRATLHRWRESLLVATVTLGQSIVFVLTTAVVDRPRPGVPHLDESPPTSSFPSGHTSAAIALYTALAVVAHRRVRGRWTRRAAMAVLLCLPVLVAIGRAYRGMHHPSDLVAAGLNAGLVLLLTDRLLRTTPLPDDGSAGAAAAPAAAPAAVPPPPTTAEVTT